MTEEFTRWRTAASPDARRAVARAQSMLSIRDLTPDWRAPLASTTMANGKAGVNCDANDFEDMRRWYLEIYDALRDLNAALDLRAALDGVVI